jgi:deoxyribonuclease V
MEHPWDLTFAQARTLQEELAPKVRARDDHGDISTVAGVDVSYNKKSPWLYAAAVVLNARTLEIIEKVGTRQKAHFPYVSGYLSFREMPAVSRVLEKLRHRPDLVVCDGQGLAHPRRFGLACHLGVLFDVPAIGCAKTRLIGDFIEPGKRRGAHRRLLHKGEIVGEVVRTRDGVKPVYVSVGHKVSLQTARKWVLRLAPKYRHPETTRAAHNEVNRLRRAGLDSIKAGAER